MTHQTLTHSGLSQIASTALFFLGVAAIVLAPAGYTAHMLG